MGEKYISYNILKLVDECQRCCDNGLYFAALSTALVLPDICAKIDIKLNKKKKDKIGVIYSNWIDAWLSPFLPPISTMSCLFIASTSWGEVIYKLRCGILHNSEIDVCGKDYKTFDLTDFNLYVSEKEFSLDAMRVNNLNVNLPGTYINETKINIDIRFLVNIILGVVVQFINHYNIDLETLMKINLED